MFKKIILSILFLTITIYANNTAKFLVLDKKTYNMIDKLNILNGGINKKVIASSNYIEENDIYKYYPEYFLFKGEKCNIISAIYDTKSNTMDNKSKLIGINNIKNEIKKLKLLQMLIDDDYIKGYNGIISKKSIKSLSLICKDKLIFRNNIYRKNSHIGKYIIEKLDFNNSIVYIKE